MLYFFRNAVYLSHSSADIVHNMIKLLFHQKFEMFFGFLILFAVYKHQRV